MPRLPSQIQERTLGPSSLSVLAMLREFGGEGRRVEGLPREGSRHDSQMQGRATQGGNLGRGAEVVGCQEEAALNLMECFG